MAFEIWRAGEVLDMELVPRRVDLPNPEGGFETRWLIGITGGMLFVPQTTRPGVVEAVGYGVEQTSFIVRAR